MREARRRQNPPLTLKAVAGDRISIAMLSRLERGDVLPSVDTLVYLAERLGITPSTLLDYDPSHRAASSSEVGIAESLSRIGRDEAALAVFQNALATTGDPRAGYGAVGALVALYRLEEAGSLLGTLPTDQPGYAEADARLALTQGRLPYALGAYARALAEMTSNHTGPDEAWPVLDRVRRANLLYGWGLAHERGENRETAARTYRMALGALTGLTRPELFASTMLDSARKSDDAVGPREAVSALVRATRLTGEIWEAMGRVELALGRRKEALAALKSALAPALNEALAFTAVAETLGAPAPHREFDDHGAARALTLLAAKYREAGQLTDGDEAFRQAARIEIAMGHLSRGAAALYEAAIMWLAAGDRDRSARVLLEARQVLDRQPSTDQRSG